MRFGENNGDLLETDFWTTSRCLAEIMPFEIRRLCAGLRLF
jgi:hypothetical protein